MTALVGEAGQILLALLGLTLVLSLVRLMRGPSLADRIVALDLMTTIGVAFCGLYAVLTDQPVFLDVAVVMALIAFVGTVAFARFLEARRKS
jgi:multicomponent Na+:H+ antiporter subunit F